LKASLPELEVDLLGCDHQGKSKEVFAELKNNYSQAVTYYGEVPERSDYYNRLKDCRLLAVTSLHDFFGLSVAEAIFHGVIPLLPRRLAYPELIPPRLHSKLLYNDYKELEHKARSLLKSGLESQERQELMKWMDQFRWPNIAKNFLELLRF
ncbi:MAG: glycosyltransferase, partial [Bacteriovoracaceae bacterium]